MNSMPFRQLKSFFKDFNWSSVWAVTLSKQCLRLYKLDEQGDFRHPEISLCLLGKLSPNPWLNERFPFGCVLQSSAIFPADALLSAAVPRHPCAGASRRWLYNTISWLKSLILIRKASPNGAASFVIYKERNHKTSLIWTPCPSGN